MRVVGLISGGKDSIWNLHYCRHFGHEVVCVAHLAPPEGVGEMDSYMYQTVGSSVVQAIASALGLPLICRTIAGQPKSIESNTYSPEAGDEVEDLTCLLKDVLEAHPTLEAVSCGAILSNYQRLRVENVCSRLGLKVVAFMWKQEQPHLLKQMVAGGLDARIVKVASMGLTEKHVGKSILDPAFASYITSLGSKWGVHVCGEGGEYESTVFDAPLYQHAIRIVDSEVVVHDAGADVVFLNVSKSEPEPREVAEDMRGPPFQVLEEYSSMAYYREAYPPFLSSAATAAPCPYERNGDLGSGPLPQRCQPPVLRRVGGLLSTSSLDANAFQLPVDHQTSADGQCKELLKAIEEWLTQDYKQSLRNAVFAEVQVRDLGCFEAVNAVYASAFDAVQPPPRVCIQTPMPEETHVRFRLLLRCAEEPSESLRVQSISTWAMACIGPYSQAFRSGGYLKPPETETEGAVGAALFSAGVIGLVPHSMALPTPAQAVEAPTCPLPTQWEAELWMTMRSLGNVLAEMECSWGDVRLAHVYAAGSHARHPDHSNALLELVLQYMRREAPMASPLITFTEQPRLPKGGQVEINVVCAPKNCADQVVDDFPAPLENCFGEPEAHTSVASIALTQAAWAASAESKVPDEGTCGHLSSDDVKAMAARCLAAVMDTLAVTPGLEGRSLEGVSLQVQHSVSLGLLAAAIEAGMQDAIQDAEATGLLTPGITVVAYMPAFSLGTNAFNRCVISRTCLRVIAIAS